MDNAQARSRKPGRRKIDVELRTLIGAFVVTLSVALCLGYLLGSGYERNDGESSDGAIEGPAQDAVADEPAASTVVTIAPETTSTAQATSVPTTAALPTTILLPERSPLERGNLNASGPVVIEDQSDVLLEDLWITNPDGDCLKISGSANVMLRNSVVGPCAGRAVWIYDSEGVEVSGSDLADAASGVYALDSSSVQVNNNRFFNIGHHFVQFDKVSGVGNQINDNTGENELATSTAIDLINLFQSRGTEDSPIEVMGNRLQNGGTHRVGSGIMLGDAGGEFQLVRGNILVNPGQVGIGVAGGSGITVELNRIYSDSFPHTNVGIYVWDQYESECGSHVVQNNLVNWTDSDGSIAGWWNSGNCGAVEGVESNDFSAAIGPEILLPN